MNLLFWNLGGNDNGALAARCISERSVDIAVLSEWGSTDLFQISSRLDGTHSVLEGMGGCEKVRMLARGGIHPLFRIEQSRYMVYLMESGGGRFVIAGTHLPDRRAHPEPDCRLHVIRWLMEDVGGLLAESSCGDLIITGDLNAGPWDKELLLPDAFNSVLYKDVIRRRGARVWNGQEFDLLYNPVLDWLSEETENYGSYYTAGPDATTYWHCLDQVLVSRSLVDGVEGLRYLRSIGNRSLMASAGPNRHISDHLPLLAQIDLGRAKRKG